MLTPVNWIRTPERLLTRVFPFFLFIFLTFTPLFPQSAKVITTIDTTVATVGDQLHLRIRAVYPTGGNALFEIPEKKLGDFEILRSQIKTPEEFQRWSQQDLELTITIYDTGSFTIPPVKVQIIDPADTTKQITLSSSEIPVKIKSVLTGNEIQLKDIKPPFEIPFLFPWKTVLSLILLFSVITLAGFYFWKRRNSRKPLKINPIYLLPPHERALQRLQKLKTLPLSTFKEIDLYFTELSNILREYLEGRFFIHALEMSTTEILEISEELELSLSNRQRLEEILTLSDLVKFARFRPDEAKIRDIYDQVKAFINETKLIIGEWEATVEKEVSHD